MVGRVAPTNKKKKGSGDDRFRYRSGQIRKDWANRGDIEVVTFHPWFTSILRIADVDESADIVEFTGRTRTPRPFGQLSGGLRYLLLNVKEALGLPGQWYLDRPTGRLTYIPMPGEKPAESIVVAPRLERLVELRGDEKAGAVAGIHFDGITFEHAAWLVPAEGHSFVQAAASTDGAIQARYAKNCAFTNCTVRGVGGYAIELGQGCRDNLIQRCRLLDLGAGGVKIGVMRGQPNATNAALRNRVHENLIAHGGRLQAAAVGVWVGRASYNRIEANHIVDFYYTGVSVGWQWGYNPSTANHNRVSYNHIHDIGQGVLSDMGGIYTLGVSPGTVLSHNRIHDVLCYSYGGWGIYLDEGSSEILVTKNLCYGTTDGGFNQHYGRENRVLNNIFAFARDAQIGLAKPESHSAFTFEQNLVVWKTGRLFRQPPTPDRKFTMRRNLFWRVGGPVRFDGKTLAQWQAAGQGKGSIVADPKFRHPERGDFSLPADSPARKIGFEPFTLATPQNTPPDYRWDVRKYARAWPSVQTDRPIRESFDDVPVDSHAPEAHTIEENATATIRVSARRAWRGKQSLRFVDAPGQKAGYNPHLYWRPTYSTGTIRARFALYLEKGANVSHEWRTAGRPYKVGPSVWIRPDGRCGTRGRELVKLPTNTWVVFEIACRLPGRGTGVWAMAITVNGRTANFRDLPCDEGFDYVGWLGFISGATDKGEFYLDELTVEPVKARPGARVRATHGSRVSPAQLCDGFGGSL